MEETTAAISEALDIVKGWNDRWMPKVWMTDCAQAEISAIENTFPGNLLSGNLVVLKFI